jgi:hypothetical protein
MGKTQTYTLNLTTEQLDAIEQLSHQEINYCREQMDQGGLCPHCLQEEDGEGHKPDCFWLVICDLHALVDTA